MTDENLDKLIQKVLVDALRMEWSDTLEEAPPMRTSPKFQHQINAMLGDPFAWYRKKIRPVWKKALQTVAVIMIAISLSFGALMAASPTVQAAVIQWVTEWYETHIVYRFSGEAISEEMPQYETAYLPEGYEEIDRFISSGYVSVTYQNQAKLLLYLDYTFMRQGSAHSMLTEEMDVAEVTVNGFAGQRFLSQTSAQSNAITWIDPIRNIQFTVDGFVDEFDLLHIAESVTLSD